MPWIPTGMTDELVAATLRAHAFIGDSIAPLTALPPGNRLGMQLHVGGRHIQKKREGSVILRCLLIIIQPTVRPAGSSQSNHRLNANTLLPK
eukprot:scaffold225_cov388-Prasinococcus_capsulatus_cf.AAC.29